MPSTMNTTTDTTALKRLTSTLINDALAEIRYSRPNSSAGKEKHFRTAEYFLLEARDYVDGAWDMLAIGNVGASLAISRWTLEAAMNLFWVASAEDKVEQRLTDLAGEALRQDANLVADLAQLWPDQAHVLQERANRARQMRNDLGSAKLEPLDNRMKDIRPPDRADWPKHYVLYRICCSAVHPGLRLWERFTAVDQATVSSESSNDTLLTPDIATHMAAATPLFLVSSCCCLTHTGDLLQELRGWWGTKVEPLLG